MDRKTAAIKIQATFRMWMVLSKNEKYEKSRIESIYIIMKQSIFDAEQAISDIYNSKEGARQLKMAEHELDKLAKIVNSKVFI